MFFLLCMHAQMACACSIIMRDCIVANFIIIIMICTYTHGIAVIESMHKYHLAKTI